MPPREHMYDPHAIYAARRKLTINGQVFHAGMLVPRALAENERVYQKWFNTRMLMSANAAEQRFGAQPDDGAARADVVSVPVPKGMAEIGAPASERLMDAVASAATIPSQESPSVPAPAITEEQRNEGYIEMSGRGWCKIYFRDKEERVRGLNLASQRLDQMRVEVGLPPLSPVAEDVKEAAAAPEQPSPEDAPAVPPSEDDPQPEVAPAPVPEIPAAEPVPLAASEPMYQGHPVYRFKDDGGDADGEAIELPDDDAPSAPWSGPDPHAEAGING